MAAPIPPAAPAPAAAPITAPPAPVAPPTAPAPPAPVDPVAPVAPVQPAAEAAPAPPPVDAPVLTGEEVFGASPEVITQLANTPAGRVLEAARLVAENMPEQADLLQTPEGLASLLDSRRTVMVLNQQLLEEPEKFLANFLMPDEKGNTPATALPKVFEKLPEAVQAPIFEMAYNRLWTNLQTKLQATQPPAELVRGLQQVAQNTALPEASRAAAQTQLDNLVTPSWGVATAMQMLENLVYGGQVVDPSIYFDTTKPVTPPWTRNTKTEGAPAPTPQVSTATQAFQEMSGPALAQLIETHVKIPTGTLPAVADALRRELYTQVLAEVEANPRLKSTLMLELGADMRAGGKPDRALAAYQAAARRSLFRIAPGIVQKYTPAAPASGQALPVAASEGAPPLAAPMTEPKREDFPAGEAGTNEFYKAAFAYAGRLRQGR